MKNYHKLLSEAISRNQNVDLKEATRLAENLYRSAIRSLKGQSRDFSVIRELYYSYQSPNLAFFDVNRYSLNDPRRRVKVGSEKFENLVGVRMKNFITRYPDVEKIYNRYKMNKIDYKTFLESVKKFKRTNRRYLTSGS